MDSDSLLSLRFLYIRRLIANTEGKTKWRFSAAICPYWLFFSSRPWTVSFGGEAPQLIHARASLEDSKARGRVNSADSKSSSTKFARHLSVSTIQDKEWKKEKERERERDREKEESKRGRQRGGKRRRLIFTRWNYTILAITRDTPGKASGL